MTIIRVAGNTYLNPACVGKVEMTQTFTGEGDGQRRQTTTEVFDVSGQNVLLTYASDVLVRSSDPFAVKRDNFFHEEIIKCLKDGCDARPLPDFAAE